jgi:DNA topoisomerase-2
MGQHKWKQSLIYEQVGKRWEVTFATSDGSFQQDSSAKSIATIKGGTHVNLIADQITKNLIAIIAKKKQGFSHSRYIPIEG